MVRKDAQPDRRKRQSAERAALLGHLPSVDECARALTGRAESRHLRRDYVIAAVRRALQKVRSGLLAAGHQPAPRRDEIAARVVALAAAALNDDWPGLRRVINATGVVLHTNLGRAALAEPAVSAIVEAARYPSNLEYDLERGARGDRDAAVEAELCALTGAEAATVVNNNAAAVLLALAGLARGREVVVSRGELIEIGGSFRLPEIMALSGAVMREVGTTNRTHPRDYAGAIGPETALLLKVHPSNFRVVGFSAAVGVAELVAIGRKHNVEVIEDLGSGALVATQSYGLGHEPTAAESIAAGAGLVSFSGDKLLGGPQAGLIVGKGALIERLRAHPLRRALRCDKLTLAALSATLRLYRRSADLNAALPTLAMLSRSADQLEADARRVLEQIAGRLDADFDLRVVPCLSQVGAGSLPAEEQPSRALRIGHRRLSPDELAAALRQSQPPVIGRVSADALLLDLRTVDDLDLLARALAAALERLGDKDAGAQRLPQGKERGK